MNDRNGDDDQDPPRPSPDSRSGDAPDPSGPARNPDGPPGGPAERGRESDPHGRGGESDSPGEGRESRPNGTGTPVSTGEEQRGESPDESEQFRSVAEKAGVDAEVIGTPRTLDRRVRYRWMVGSTVGAVLIGAVAVAGAYVFAGAVPGVERGVVTAAAAGGAVFTLFFLLGIVRAVLLYRSWEYVVREDSLFLSRGVLTRVRTVAPYVRVQHVDTRRSPVERLLGLSTLVVYTAGSRGADVTIPGLTPDRATDLQERLKRLAIESEEEDAV